MRITHLRHYALLTMAIMWMTAATAQSHKPWVRNISAPSHPTKGLDGRHIGVWPSHGRYYNFKTGEWEWQRPLLYGTVEDLFTQSIVIPYLIPMLENAGAYVYVPRERDWQKKEYIVDNDKMSSGYMEFSKTEVWKEAPRAGFAIKGRPYVDAERPFAMGTARIARTIQDGEASQAYYRPNITESGRYAVYVSYQTVEGSINDAEYTVVHQGKQTKFTVNQQMGSGTWVYLGTFDFDAGSTFNNYVKVTNKSQQNGFVTTDAVKFGGGMGDHERGGRTSSMPRAMECARYWAQYAGAPRAAVCSKGGRDDYGDDINVRSLMSNWLSYGATTNPTNNASPDTTSPDTTTLADAAAHAYRDSMIATVPDSMIAEMTPYIDSMATAIRDSVSRVPLQLINVMKGKALTGRVPLEMQLALHSDAGYEKDFKTVYGTLTICTSNFNNNMLAAGDPRTKSYTLACDLLYDINRDLKKHFPDWVVREVWDKNYSETRLPAQTSAIVEMLSHESFPDMKYGHDPYFKFVLARSIYKTILKTLTRNSGIKPVVQPLAPRAFSASILRKNTLTITWKPQADPHDKTATPASYNIYTKVGNDGYDNGRNVVSTEYTINLQPNKIYRFRVTAVNEGGESFPSEELVAMYNPEAGETALIVNAFNRLSSPAVIENDNECGFDLKEDIGLSYGKTLAWVGCQANFNKKQAGKWKGLGHTNAELAGRFTAGNDFNYSYDHAEALAYVNKYSIISTSREAFENDSLLTDVTLLDVLFGNEKDDGHSLIPYKTFTPKMKKSIERYVNKNCHALISGSYVASDMKGEDEIKWQKEILGIRYGGTDRDSIVLHPNIKADAINILGLPVQVYRHINEDHYASVSSDIILPSDSISPQAYTPMANYSTGNTAAVLNENGGKRLFVMGFPFECIKSVEDRHSVMNRIIALLRKEKY